MLQKKLFRRSLINEKCKNKYIENMNTALFSCKLWTNKTSKQTTLNKKRSIHKEACHKCSVQILTHVWHKHFLHNLCGVWRGHLPHKNVSFPLWLATPSSPSLPLCSSKSHKHDKAPYIFSSWPESPQANLFARLFTCPQAEITPHLSHDIQTDTFNRVPSPRVWPTIRQILKSPKIKAWSQSTGHHHYEY